MPTPEELAAAAKAEEARAIKREKESGLIRIPRALSENLSSLVILGGLSLVGGTGGGLLGGRGASAEVTKGIEEIKAAQKEASDDQKLLAKSVNDLRSEFAVLQAGKLDERLRELERQVATIQGRGGK